MKLYAVVFLLATFVPLTRQQPWSLQGFIEDKLLSLKEQKNEVNKLMYDEYEDKHMYFKSQQKKVIDDIYKYIDGITNSGNQNQTANPWLNISDDGSTVDNPDVFLTTPAIITRHGYLCETHTVISQGHVLTMHRIPRSKNGEDVPEKTVLLQHGIFASSADWVLNGPDKALAYVLADAGFDVWMSNIRGNRYSREHTSLKSDSKLYWNFSWHDVAKYDIPAVIDYIVSTKGRGTKITYIGYSMGTTILFAMLTVRPEYNRILTAGFALAPVVYLSDIKSPIKTFAPVASSAAYMEMLYKSHEFVPKNSALGKITGSCTADSTDSTICKNIAFYICGFNENQFNKTLLPVFLSHLGTGTSWKTVVHFAQEINSGGEFQQFDYGVNNVMVYGSWTPPEYDLKRITLPIRLFWSKNDLLSSERDVKKLYSNLQGNKEMYLVPDPNFNHLDYIWAIDAPRLLNKKILEYLGRAFGPRLENHSSPRHTTFNFNPFRLWTIKK